MSRRLSAFSGIVALVVVSVSGLEAATTSISSVRFTTATHTAYVYPTTITTHPRSSTSTTHHTIGSFTASTASHALSSTASESSKTTHTKPTTSSPGSAHTASTSVPGNVCIYTASPHATCLANPIASLAAANARASVVGALLGTMLGAALMVALLVILFLRRKLTRANRIVKEQSNVLWRIRGRDDAGVVGAAPARPPRGF